MLWGSMRHIVSPSVADGAFHYYEKISFQLFFVTQEKVKHIYKGQPFLIDSSFSETNVQSAHVATVGGSCLSKWPLQLHDEQLLYLYCLSMEPTERQFEHILILLFCNINCKG